MKLEFEASTQPCTPISNKTKCLNLYVKEYHTRYLRSVRSCQSTYLCLSQRISKSGPFLFLPSLIVFVVRLLLVLFCFVFVLFLASSNLEILMRKTLFPA